MMPDLGLARLVIQLSWSFGSVFVLYGLYKLVTIVYDEVTSPLRDLPGPPCTSFIFGNFKEVWESESGVLHERWVEQYGNTLQHKGLFRRTRLFTTDLKALNHVLANSYIYQKPQWATYNIKRNLGEGVLLVEGDAHKNQRKVLNPAFGPQQIRELTKIFVAKSIQLRDIWAAEASSRRDGTPARLDALSWLSRATLDVIGLAGFNHKFNALANDPEKDELSKALSEMLKAGNGFDIILLIRGMFPLLRFLPAERDAVSKKAGETMRRIGATLLKESKAAIIEGIDKKDTMSSRDLLSLLVRANTMSDLPANQRMTDTDVLAQIPTFIVAGHETTSTATTWALFSLTQHKSVQRKLRDELSTISTDNPTMDELNSLSYLDAVVRETLRLHSPVPFTIRVAMQDDCLPLSEPFVDRKGVTRHELRIRKGQLMTIPIVPVNRATSLWGDDAREFKPERWQNPPESVAAIPGIWGNMLTFLGGPKACIGYRFALVEMKALLFTLVRAFEFDLAVPASEIAKKTGSGVVQRPILLSDPDNSNQLPLLVSIVAQN